MGPADRFREAKAAFGAPWRQQRHSLELAEAERKRASVELAKRAQSLPPRLPTPLRERHGPEVRAPGSQVSMPNLSPVPSAPPAEVAPTPSERGDNLDLDAMRRAGPTALRIDMAHARRSTSGLSQIGHLKATISHLQAAIRCLEEGDDPTCEHHMRLADSHRARSGRRNSVQI